jgi:hypothetical protein
LGKSVRINSTVTTPPSITSNKVPTPTTIKPARTIEGSMGPPPVRPRPSLSTTTSPTGVFSCARVVYIFHTRSVGDQVAAGDVYRGVPMANLDVGY